MCEHCNHGQEPLCTCGPVQGGDSFRMAVHLAENMTDVDWHLTYNSLKDIHPYQLCMVGKCKVCGGRLCIEQKTFGIVTTDDFLATAYRHLYQFHHNLAQPLSTKAFREKFVEMFRKEDRAAIEDWLALPENSHVARMYRRSVKGAYIIVHSWADADQGEFPSPSGVATFTDREKARAELNRLVTEEKENMEIPFSKELYREEYGDDFWEAYRDGTTQKLARQFGLASMSAQAVGGAVGHNPISIIIPCHRVVGTHGSLTGYAGGLDKKIFLLQREGVDVSRFSIPEKGTAL